MRRAGLAVALCACALLGALAAAVAGPSTASPGTTSAPTTTAPPPATTTAPAVTLPDGVTVGGILVGGLDPAAAEVVVRTSFASPLVLTVAGRTLMPTPESLGAVAYVKNALAKARTASPGTQVPLYVRLDGKKIRAYVGLVAKRFDREPVDAKLVLRRLKPFLARERPGRALDRAAAFAAIADALRTNSRLPVALELDARPARVTRKNFGPVVVIRRESKRLSLYEGMRHVRTFVVATGAPRYPTPLGRFRLIAKWKNPWWYPPDSDWARGQDPIPPGPGNPLGTRWMGISSPGVGIHGTPDAASLGYSVSHGCIRLAIRDAEWLFQRVRVGAPVFIVRA